MIATVFLGAFVGLNLDGRQWCGRSEFYGYRGWPFPAVLVVYERGDYEGPDRDPWTHQTYELVLADRLGWMLNWEAYGAGYASIYVFCAIADALLGIVVLGTVLCFQVPAARKAERRIWFSPKSLAAGMILLFALVAISLHATWTANIYAGKSDGTIPGCPYDSSRSYGWPFILYLQEAEVTFPSSAATDRIQVWTVPSGSFRWSGLVADILIVLTIVSSGAAVCELLIRRNAEKTGT